MKEMGVPSHIVVLWRKCKSEVAFKTEFEATAGKFNIVKGVRQGCILSHLLFNIYSEKIMTEALDKWKGGIGTGGSGKKFEIRG